MIEVVSVVQRALERGGLKAAVDAPRPGEVLPGYSVEISGWAAASEGHVAHIAIGHGGSVVRSAPLSERRTDVFNMFGLLGGDTVGFRTRVNLLGLPLRPTLIVCARVAGDYVELAEVVLQRKALRVSPPPPIHPLIVTTMGRTGSVWFSRLVGEHPAIVSHRPFESEPRVGSYWAHVLRALADPASVTQGLAPLGMQGNWWLGPEQMGTFPPVHDPEVATWLFEDHPERLARFCLDSASAFYERVAALQQKSDVVYYVEKYLPAFVPSLLCELDTGAKEVFLVRDPRDQLASVVSWTSTGRAKFSEDATTADEYIDWLAPRTKSILNHWRARADRSLLVRYEDLVLEPLPTLTRLFDYLEIDSSPQTVAAVLDSARRAGPRHQRAHQTSKSPEQSVGRWRRDVSRDLWERLDDVFAPELESWYPDFREEATVSPNRSGNGSDA